MAKHLTFFLIFLFHYFLSDEDRSDDDSFTINFLSDVAYIRLVQK